MSELVLQPMWRMAEMIRNREISCVELMEAHLKRIEEVNPQLNAVVEVAADRAMAEARVKDRAPSEAPFHGVPMSVKGAWDCAGMVNTGGTLGRKGVIAGYDATVIGRMRRAGMIPLGMTNLPEFSMAFESDNLIYGHSNNPFDLTRTPGGSGGGGAAAIASGCSPFEVGADLGGSIRVPSHFCGIAGLKTTLGRVPLTGYFPGPFGATTLCSTAGPMARTVRDLALTLPLLNGPDMLDAGVVDARLRPVEDVRVGSLRVAFHTDNGIYPVTLETEETVRRAAKAVAETGAHVEETRPEGLEDSLDIMLSLLGFDGGAGFAYLTQTCGTTESSPSNVRLLEVLKTRLMSAPEIATLLVRRDVYRMKVQSFFLRYDAIVCPVSAFPALPHGETGAKLAGFSYTMAHNLSGCPGAVVRFGTSADGLPIGVQIVAAHWREDIALAVAQHLEGMGSFPSGGVPV